MHLRDRPETVMKSTDGVFIDTITMLWQANSEYQSNAANKAGEIYKMGSKSHYSL